MKVFSYATQSENNYLKFIFKKIILNFLIYNICHTPISFGNKKAIVQKTI